MSDSEEIWSAGLRKNSKDEVRVTLSMYKGLPLLGLRVWFKAEDGTYRPGKDGFSVRVEQGPALRQLLEEGLMHAVKRGFLTEDALVKKLVPVEEGGLSSLIDDLSRTDDKRDG